MKKADHYYNQIANSYQWYNTLFLDIVLSLLFCTSI